ncbi:hypothetical protein FHW36_10437 [Chitinophaga polysaccharea]|uniref:Uncharacterized protein n=1 Tax=Chitinophaga polysaccharea TaxID=1293035 RepID=A0A561PQE9_9BACT|nr:hypothetical protein FHW36_10437 [Chitinophaga polysaccharea]
MDNGFKEAAGAISAMVTMKEIGNTIFHKTTFMDNTISILMHCKKSGNRKRQQHGSAKDTLCMPVQSGQ